MDFRQINDTLTVSPQIGADDMPAIKVAGFRSIICNRPDGEGEDQPEFARIAAAAKTLDIEPRYVPVRSGMVSDEDVAAFGAALSEMRPPILAYCRTGTRSAMLWSLHEAKLRQVTETSANVAI